MQLTEQHRRQVLYGYCILFYLVMFWKFLNGLFLFQLQPLLFNNRFDLLTWLLMKTNIHQWLVGNHLGWILFDALFYSLPLLWLLTHKKKKLSVVVSITMLIMNYTYIQVYALYPAASIEGSIAWLLFPLLFMTTSLMNFYFVLHGLRYFLLFFFASAAVWKFVQGGVFNIDQMSGVLLMQHKEFLTSSPSSWYTHLVYWLVDQPVVSYLLYVAATLLELSFIIGFFSKTRDHYLIAAALVFLLTDLFFMRISYWEISPFLLTLLVSKYKIPIEKTV